MLLIHVHQTWLEMYPYPDIKIYVYLETKCMINVQKIDNLQKTVCSSTILQWQQQYPDSQAYEP